MDIKSIFAQQLFSGEVRFDEPLKKHTMMRVGGPAKVMLIPKNIEDIKQAVQLAKTYNLPIQVIGRGSNLLICDEGIEGLVIKISDGLDELEVYENEAVVGAGYSLIRFATKLSRQGFGGLTFACGIPGNIGGAIYMNAGAHGSEMAKIVKRVLILDESCQCRWLDVEEMEFAYRTSILQKHPDWYCLQVVCTLQKGDVHMIMQEIEKNKSYRQLTQPWEYPNCGSVFRNPLPLYAGKLIEEADLKGKQIGGAMISTKHANFIVNTGEATAQDVFDLIAFVQETIFTRNQIHLQTEVELIKKLN